MVQSFDEQLAPPTRPKQRTELADIFRQHFDGYREEHHLRPEQHKAARAIMDCRTPVLGGHHYWCEDCVYERYAYNSCSNRNCPKCQALRKAKWLEARLSELLPVPYFHNVFTLAHELNSLILWDANNQRALLDLLFHSASQTLLQFGQNNLGGEMGFLMVLHTWDQQLRAHYHVHCLIPGGALKADRSAWIESRPDYLFPVQALSQVFRGKYLEGVRRLIKKQKLKLPPQLEHLSNPKALQSWLRRLRTKSWVVYSKAPFSGPEKVLDYLGRYVHRVGLSNERIVSATADQICFTYKDRRDEDRKKVACVAPEEFIRRFMQHVLAERYWRIRPYGFLSNSKKKEALKAVRELLGMESVSPPKRKSTAEWVKELTGVDINRCPECGAALLSDKIPPEPLRAEQSTSDKCSEEGYVQPDTS